MFEAHDFVENMEKVWMPHRDQGTEMYLPKFLIRGKRVFLGSDFHFLYNEVGHQRATSKYPCLYDLVDPEHIWNHTGVSASLHILLGVVLLFCTLALRKHKMNIRGGRKAIYRVNN